MTSGSVRLKIVFDKHVPLNEVEEFISTSFGGFGSVERSDEPRTIFLVDTHWPYDIDTVIAQLSAFQRDGLLTWERATQ
jgi:hypothetical protein